MIRIEISQLQRNAIDTIHFVFTKLSQFNIYAVNVKMMFNSIVEFARASNCEPNKISYQSAINSVFIEGKIAFAIFVHLN